MDTKELRGKLVHCFRKYKYAVLILIFGLALMAIPVEKKNTESPPVRETEREEDLETRLARILSQVEGAGKVTVLLTPQSGEEILYQTDEDRSADGSVRIDTVVISGSDRAQQGLIRTVTPQTYLGAIVVCQGADSPQIRFELVRAVSNVTGIGYDRISVVKMK